MKEPTSASACNARVEYIVRGATADENLRRRRDIGVSRDMGILAAGNPSGSRLECMYVRSKSTPFRNRYVQGRSDTNVDRYDSYLPSKDHETILSYIAHASTRAVSTFFF